MHPSDDTPTQPRTQCSSQASPGRAVTDASAPVDVEAIVRSRLRSLRLALGWSLDDLAARSNLSASTLSRIENGKRTISLDVLQPLSRALQTDLPSLLDVEDEHGDVVIRPVPSTGGGRTVWPLTRIDANSDVIAAKWRLEPDDSEIDPQVHPGHDWFFVLSGAIRLTLGERTIIVNEGEAAQFSTMTPHHMAAHEHPAEIVTVFDRTGHRAHHVQDGAIEERS
ncbi:MAG: helix-turn-helix domain-containing protein [Ilumatobacteraceae bacterium]